MSLIKVVWYMLRVKNIHPGSPSDPSVTATAEAKPRYVYTILNKTEYYSVQPCPEGKFSIIKSNDPFKTMRNN